jgi:hypothetical protein
MVQIIDFDFSYESLNRELDSIKSFLPITSFTKLGKDSALILRCDVDYSLANILEFANKISEHVSSCTFFFLLTSDSYNLHSKLGRKILQEIKSLDFEVGLHFDEAVYGVENEDVIVSKLKTEVTTLEQIYENEVISFSLHNPSINGMRKLTTDYISAYDDKFFSPTIYRSDSRMKFPSDLQKIISENHVDTYFQLLLHPEHYGHNPFNYIESLNRHTQFARQTVVDTLSVNSTFISEYHSI